MGAVRELRFHALPRGEHRVASVDTDIGPRGISELSVLPNKPELQGDAARMQRLRFRKAVGAVLRFAVYQPLFGLQDGVFCCITTVLAAAAYLYIFVASLAQIYANCKRRAVLNKSKMSLLHSATGIVADNIAAFFPLVPLLHRVFFHAEDAVFLAAVAQTLLYPSELLSTDDVNESQPEEGEEEAPNLEEPRTENEQDKDGDNEAVRHRTPREPQEET
jgi:hypothetical protein